MFFAMAIGKESVPSASVFGGDFIILYAVCGGLIVGALWFAFLNFRRAFRPPRTEHSVSVAAADQTAQLPSTATPDEKPAHLLKQPND